MNWHPTGGFFFACRRSRPHLLVVPASLLGNWEDEIRRFTPSLKYRIEHPSAPPGTAGLADYDLVITTYGYLTRQPPLQKQPWEIVILDEAQAIKNHGTRQTHAVKSLVCRSRLVLTGTPVENRPGDLWSIFDFLNPGLLGTAADFNLFCKRPRK
ncbi:MAG TPA: SNF2-related protein [Candidatus Rifleibacterium sp.]|nr:SNF2-related protein [Candidatus Rifleibacterium sp.]HPT47554.1 SNF2-related protein [Candidatus Rifleibacterium sp.]